MARMFAPKRKSYAQRNAKQKNNKNAMAEFSKCKKDKKLSLRDCQKNYFASLKRG